MSVLESIQCRCLPQLLQISPVNINTLCCEDYKLQSFQTKAYFSSTVIMSTILIPHNYQYSFLPSTVCKMKTAKLLRYAKWMVTRREVTKNLCEDDSVDWLHRDYEGPAMCKMTDKEIVSMVMRDMTMMLHRKGSPWMLE